MGLLKGNIRITPESFINNESSKAVDNKSKYIAALFSACKAQSFNPAEAAIFSGLLPLLAMSLARLDANIQRGYAHEFSQRIDVAHGNSSGDQFQERILEYLSAFEKDVAEGNGDKLPSLLSSALNNICGASDETVALCRMGLLQFLLPSLKANVEHFGKITFVDA